MWKKALVMIASLAALSCSGKEKSAPAKKSEPVQQAKKTTEKPKEAKPAAQAAQKPKAEEKKKAEEAQLPIEAVIMEVAGKVEVSRADGDGYQPAKADEKLYVGDMVRVSGEEGFARIRMWDDTIILLSAGSEVSINPGAGVPGASPSITVLAGLSSLMVEPREEGQDVFTVYTPTAELAVLGTEFDVGIALTGEVAVGVSEGVVEVTLQGSAKAVRLEKGKKAVIPPDSPKPKVVPYRPEKENWVGWLESKAEEAEKAPVRVVTITDKRVEELKKRLDELSASLDKITAQVEQRRKKLEELAKKGDVKGYEKEATPTVEMAVEGIAGVEEVRKLRAMIMANAYLLARLRALLGNVKLSPQKKQELEKKLDEAGLLLADLRVKLRGLPGKWGRAMKEFKTVYYAHTKEGRALAPKVGIELPKPWLKVPPLKVVTPQKPRYLRGIRRLRLGRRYRGKFRRRVPGVRGRRRGSMRLWVRRPWKPSNPARLERLKKLRTRFRRMRRRRRVVLPRRIPRPRFRRPSRRLRPPAGRLNPGAVMGVRPPLVNPGLPMGVPRPGVMVPGRGGMPRPAPMGMGPSGRRRQGQGDRQRTRHRRLRRRVPLPPGARRPHLPRRGPQMGGPRDPAEGR